ALFCHKGLYRLALYLGIDAPDSLGHHHYLGLADGAIEGMDLAIDVGHADVVQVNQRDLADAAAGKRFRRPGADAANADDTDMGPGQGGQPTVAIQASNAAKPVIEVIGHGGYLLSDGNGALSGGPCRNHRRAGW